MPNKEGDADADGCQESCLVLDRSQHDDAEDEHRGGEHFDKDASDDACFAIQSYIHSHGAGKQS
jgi:hypothetical protein